MSKTSSAAIPESQLTAGQLATELLTAELLTAELLTAMSKHSSLPAAESARGAGSVMTANQIMEREYLEMRALILQLAASLDRLQRSKSPAANEEKLQQLRLGVQILLSENANRANLVQMLFSNQYCEKWPTEFDLQLKPEQRS